MNKKLVVFFAILSIGLSIFAVSAISASAQELPDNNTTTTVPPTTQPPTTTSNGTSETNVNIPVGQLVRPQEDDVNSPDTVYIDLGVHGHVYDIKYDKDDEFVTVYFNIERTADISLADANYETPAGKSYSTYHDLTLPRGESKIRIQNDRIENQQCIALNGDGTPDDRQIIYCDNDKGGETLVPLWIYILSLFLVAIGTLWYLYGWFKNQSVDGPPRTSDGVELPKNSKYGDLTEVENDE